MTRLVITPLLLNDAHGYVRIEALDLYPGDVISAALRVAVTDYGTSGEAYVAAYLVFADADGEVLQEVLLGLVNESDGPKRLALGLIEIPPTATGLRFEVVAILGHVETITALNLQINFSPEPYEYTLPGAAAFTGPQGEPGVGSPGARLVTVYRAAEEAPNTPTSDELPPPPWSIAFPAPMENELVWASSRWLNFDGTWDGSWTGPGNVRGPVGPTGPMGQGLDIHGVLADVGSLPVAGDFIGQVYLIGADLHVWDGTGWVVVGAALGPEGPQGPVGPAGGPGPVGPDGPPADLAGGRTTRGVTWTSLAPIAAAQAQPVYCRVPSDTDIVRCTISTIGGAGSCLIDVRLVDFGSGPGDASDSICGGNKPEIVAGTSLFDSALTDWTTFINAGKELVFVLEESSVFTSIFMSLELVARIEATSSSTVHSMLTGLSADDHPHYLNQARGDARYRPLGIDIPVADIDGLIEALAGAASMGTWPYLELTGNITLNASHAGKMVFSNSFSTRQITLPATTNLSFPVGASVRIYNSNAAGTVQIIRDAGMFNAFLVEGDAPQATGDWSMAGSTGMAEIYRLSASAYLIRDLTILGCLTEIT